MATMTKARGLTIEQAVFILDRSERGRVVGRELRRFLGGAAAAIDLDGKVAVLALIEEAFINRPGSVDDALASFDDERVPA